MLPHLPLFLRLQEGFFMTITDPRAGLVTALQTFGYSFVGDRAPSTLLALRLQEEEETLLLQVVPSATLQRIMGEDTSFLLQVREDLRRRLSGTRFRAVEDAGSHEGAVALRLALR